MNGPLSAGRRRAGAGGVAGSNVSADRPLACKREDGHEKLMARPA